MKSRGMGPPPIPLDFLGSEFNQMQWKRRTQGREGEGGGQNTENIQN